MSEPPGGPISEPASRRSAGRGSPTLAAVRTPGPRAPRPSGLATGLAAVLAAFVAALLVAVLLILLLSRISVDQPLESRELIGWGIRWGWLLAVALAAAAGLGPAPPAGWRTIVRSAALAAAATLVLCLAAMGLAVAAVRLGLWGQGWGLPSRSSYAAQIAGLQTAQWAGPAAAALGAWGLWRQRRGRSLLPRPHLLEAGRALGLDGLTRLLSTAIVIAVLLNGLPFWARRVGLIERAAHRRDVALFCSRPVQPLWLPASCRPHRLLPAQGPAPARRKLARLDWLRLYAFTPAEAAIKSLRLAWLPLLVAGSAWLALARRRPLRTPLAAIPALRARLPLLPLLLSNLLSLGLSLPLDGPLATLLSGVWFLWLPLAALGGWLTTATRLRILADAAAALVLLQLPFLLLEASQGLPLPFGGPAVAWLPTRLSGLMNQPNTLGALMAVSVALCVCVAGRRWQRWPLLAIAAAISLLARSGTGLLGLTLVAALLLARRCAGRSRRLLVLLLLLAALVVGLPRIVGRPDVLRSPEGRIRTVRIWLQSPHTPQEWLLGYGAASQQAQRERIRGISVKPRGPSADDMPSLLIVQGGLLALVSFYGLLLWCGLRDPAWRIFWIVLFATSLTTKLSEVVPINLWMAVATARALNPAAPRD